MKYTKFSVWEKNNRLWKSRMARIVDKASGYRVLALYLPKAKAMKKSKAHASKKAVAMKAMKVAMKAMKAPV